MSARNCVRYDLALGEPPLYVLVDAPVTASSLGPAAPDWMLMDEPVQRVHVMSPASGGEIRSYWIARGQLYHADVHALVWTEVDAEVARVTGLRFAEIAR